MVSGTDFQEPKWHTTVTITEEIVDRYDPCRSGKENALAAGVLPCTLSTDPDENVDLALRVAQLVASDGVPDECLGCRVTTTGYHVEWLAKMMDALDVEGVDWALHYSTNTGDHFDLVSRLAQCFAWVADKLATEEGR